MRQYILWFVCLCILTCPIFLAIPWEEGDLSQSGTLDAFADCDEYVFGVFVDASSIADVWSEPGTYGSYSGYASVNDQVDNMVSEDNPGWSEVFSDGCSDSAYAFERFRHTATSDITCGASCSVSNQHGSDGASDSE